ncbi:MAG TPA: MYXO-CTERM sorting domain-containing protein [Polyangiaceae bacterium]
MDANEQPIRDAKSPPGGWTPSELEAAYGLPATGGNGKLIATYIGSHYTNAEADMATYRSKFGLPPCTSANGCFKQVADDGSTDFSNVKDDGCNGFVGEESLDMAMLQAGCPDCKILLIEGNDDGNAVATAKKLGAISVSMSWGTGASVSDCKNNWTPPSGMALFAASGDQGYTSSPGEPAECTNVIAVGWTQLATDSSARGYADTLPSGWGSAGGCSTQIAKGAWQTDPSCSKRMVSDVSANGDNVAVYCTSPAGSGNWQVTGGSSASSPFTSGALAMLGVTTLPGFGPSWLYANQKKFWDVTSGGPVGNCPSGSPDYYCNAVAGYDGPTGVGTPYGPMLGTETDAGAGDVDAGSKDGGGASSGSSGGGTSNGSGGGTGSGSGSGGGVGSGSGSGSGGSVGGSGNGGESSSGSTHSGGSSGGASNGNDPSSSNGAQASGCGCQVVGGSASEPVGASLAMFPLLALFGLVARGRRRRATHEAEAGHRHRTR